MIKLDGVYNAVFLNALLVHKNRTPTSVMKYSKAIIYLRINSNTIIMMSSLLKALISVNNMMQDTKKHCNLSNQCLLPIKKCVPV